MFGLIFVNPLKADGMKRNNVILNSLKQKAINRLELASFDHQSEIVKSLAVERLAKIAQKTAAKLS